MGAGGFVCAEGDYGRAKMENTNMMSDFRDIVDPDLSLWAKDPNF